MIACIQFVAMISWHIETQVATVTGICPVNSNVQSQMVHISEREMFNFKMYFI